MDTSGAPGLKDAVDRLSSLQKTANSLSQQMRYLTGAFSSFLGYLSISQLTQMADSFTNITRRLSLTAQAGEDTNVTFQKLADMADRTRISVGSAGDTYNRLAQALAGAKPSADQIIAVEEGLQNTFKLSGVSAQQAALSIDALARAFARGQIQGRDLKSVLGDNTVLLEAFRKKFGSDLTQKAQQGIIKLSDLLKVLASIQDEAKKKAEALGPTYGETLTRAMNRFTIAVGEANERMGLNKGFAETMEGVMNHLGEIIAVVAAGIYAVAVPAIIAAISRLKAAWLGLVETNPFLALGAAIAFVVVEIITHFDAIKRATELFRASILDLVATLEEKFLPIREKIASWTHTGGMFNFAADKKNIEDLRKMAQDIRDKIAIEDQKQKAKLNVPGSADTKALANSKGLDQPSDKPTKLKDELAKLNQAYTEGKLSLEQYNRALEQFDLYKLNRQFHDGAIDILKYNEGVRKLDIARINREFGDGSITFAQWNQNIRQTNIDTLNEKFAVGAVSVYEYHKQLIAMSDEFLPGSALRVGIYDYMESIGTLSQNIAKGITTAFGQLESAFEEFIKKGTFDFAKFTQDILDDMEKIIVKSLIMKPLTDGVLGALGVGSVPKTGTSSTDYNPGPNGINSQHALGAAFSGGVRMFADGGVVSRSTMFRYNGNQTGVMGEAGTEAILPLRRGAGGQLGVQATPSHVFVNITNTSGAQISQSESAGPNGERTIEIMVESAVAKGMSSGKYDKVMNASYGLKRKGN